MRFINLVGLDLGGSAEHQRVAIVTPDGIHDAYLLSLRAFCFSLRRRTFMRDLQVIPQPA